MSYSPLCYRFRDQGERHEWWEGGKRGNFHFRFRPSHHPPVVFPQGKWNWIFIGYKVCGDSHILAESCCISVNAEVSVLSAVLGSSWSVRSLAKECATHPLLLEPEIRTVRTLVMGSWRRKLNTLNHFQSKDHNWNLKFNLSMFCAPCWRPHCTHFELANCISFSTSSR